MSLLVRLILVFFAGFAGWFVTLARTYALLERQKWLLCSFVFIEETVILAIGIWLARQGTFLDVMACALGSVVACYIVMGYKDGSRKHN